MASTQMFEAALKEVVQAKRLSASKMTKLTEIAMKSLLHDTELVLVLFKTHKGLAPSQKVSSLYVFDALVRAAHNHVVKHSVVADSAPGKGNAATFLAKIEGIVEGLFEDMIFSGAPEAQDKTKKILDIWIKANALPPATLKRLGDIVKGKTADQKELPNENLISIDPRSNRSPVSSVTPPIPNHVPPPQAQLPPPTAFPPTATPTTPGSEGLQSTLVALLTQAATQVNGDNPQTGANNNAAQSAALLNHAGLDANQLALLQQLARAAKDGTGGQNPPNQAAPLLPSVVANGMFPLGPGPNTLNLPPTDPRASRNDGPAPRYESEGRYQGGSRRYDDDYDRRDRDYGRGGGRGRGRGRGRGGYHGGWDDRSSYRDRDRDERESLSPRRHMRHGRSRSRSPPRGPRREDVPRRDQRVRSPSGMDPRQPPMPQPAVMKSHGPEKDEFGRDIRPGSVDPEPFPMPATQPAIIPTPAAPIIQNSSIVRDPTPDHQNPTLQFATAPPMNGANPEAAMPIATYESRAGETNTTKGLDSFDFTTFDFTSPASWEALGKTWEVTNGVTPTQEMLMQFVMMSSMGVGMGMGTSMGGLGMEQPQNQWNGAEGSGGWDAGGTEWNDEEVGVVGEAQDQEIPDEETAGPEEEDTPVLGEGSVGLTGKMQKVGNRWVFVRS